MSDKTYSYVITDIAESDLEEIFGYLLDGTKDIEIAKQVIEKITESILELVHFPYKYESLSEQFFREIGYRKMNIYNYNVIYRVVEEKNELVILRVVHGKRKYY
jgi:plasmid stabilization system protein ParE